MVVTPHPDLGGLRYHPAHRGVGGVPWHPARRRLSASVTPGEPTDLQRYAHAGIIMVGLFLAFLAWPHRKKFGGAVALSAGSGALGVGIAFLTFDLIGFRPGGRGECL